MVLYWSLRNRKGLKVALQRPFSGWEAHELDRPGGHRRLFQQARRISRHLPEARLHHRIERQEPLSAKPVSTLDLSPI